MAQKRNLGEEDSGSSNKKAKLDVENGQVEKTEIRSQNSVDLLNQESDFYNVPKSKILKKFDT